MGVKAGADGGAADGEIVETVECAGDGTDIAVKHIDVAGKFLAERERRGIVQMGAADFDDVRKFFGFGIERVAKIFYRGKQPARRFRGGGNVHGGGKGVVGGLRHVDVVVGIDGLLAAHDAAGDFDGAIGDQFGDVHGVLRATAGLPDPEREVVVQFSGDN